MKTIKDDYKRKRFFDMVLENYYNNYDDVVKHQLKAFSRFDIIRLTNYLAKYHSTLYVDINGAGELNLFSSK